MAYLFPFDEIEKKLNDFNEIKFGENQQQERLISLSSFAPNLSYFDSTVAALFRTQEEEQQSTSDATVRRQTSAYQFINRMNYYLTNVFNVIRPVKSIIKDELEGKEIKVDNCFDYNESNTFQSLQLITQSQDQNEIIQLFTSTLDLVFKYLVQPIHDYQTQSYQYDKNNDISELQVYNLADDYLKSSEDKVNTQFLKSHLKQFILDNVGIVNQEILDKSSFLFNQTAISPLDYDIQKCLIRLSDVLYFLDLFIEKLSKVKRCQVQINVLRNQLTTENFNKFITDTYENDYSVFNTTTVTIRPLAISKKDDAYVSIDDADNTIDSTTTKNKIYNEAANILLSHSGSVDNPNDVSNKMSYTLSFSPNIIYDSDNSSLPMICPDTRHIYDNTNGIFSCIVEKIVDNKFKLMLSDIQKQYNLYPTSMISRKTLLKVIDQIFVSWYSSMSSVTYSINICHSNCHENTTNLTVDENYRESKTIPDFYFERTLKTRALSWDLEAVECEFCGGGGTIHTNESLVMPAIDQGLKKKLDASGLTMNDIYLRWTEFKFIKQRSQMTGLSNIVFTVPNNLCLTKTEISTFKKNGKLTINSGETFEELATVTNLGKKYFRNKIIVGFLLVDTKRAISGSFMFQGKVIATKKQI